MSSVNQAGDAASSAAGTVANAATAGFNAAAPVVVDAAGTAANAATAGFNAAAPVVVDAAGTAANAATAGFNAAAPVVVDAAGTAADAAAPMVHTAADSSITASTSAASGIKELMVTSMDAVDDFFESTNFTELGQNTLAWGGAAANTAYNSSPTEIAAVLSSFHEQFASLVTFDIFRDFFQIIGLFFAGFEFPDTFKQFWGRFAPWFNFSIDIVLPNIQFTVALSFWITLVLATIFLGLFYWQLKKNPSDLEDGIWVIKFEERKWQKVPKYTLVLLMTVYLPITRNAVEVLVCSSAWLNFLGECYKGAHWVYVITSVVSLCAITFYFPYQVYGITKEYRPDERPFNARGDTLSNDQIEAEYEKDVQAVRNPYKFLFDAIFGTQNLILQGIIILVILAGYVIFSFWSSPFLKRSDDLMDQAARVTTFITAIFGLITAFLGSTGTVQNILGWVLNVLQLANTALMVFFFVLGSEKFRNKWKKWTKTIDLTSDPSLKHHLVFSDALMLNDEIKERCWQEFWSSLFLTHEDFKPPEEQKFSYHDAGDTAPTLLNFQGTVGERLMEMKRVMEDQGYAAVSAACEPQPPEIYAARQYVWTQLSGTDCYWDGPCEGDKTKQSKTHFGVLHITPFPFMPYIVYDETKFEHSFIRSSDLLKFVAKNREPEIVRRREVRLRLRALDGVTVHHPLTKKIKKSKPDADGNSRTLVVTMYFTNGDLKIKRRRKVIAPIRGTEYDIGPGFNVEISYSDGYGTDSEGTKYENEKYVATKDDIGIDNEFTQTPVLTKLFQNNAEFIKRNLPMVRSQGQNYRLYTQSLDTRKIKTLRHEFYHFVFNRVLARPHLVDYLTKFEINPEIRNITETHKEGLDFLYSKLKAVTANPIAAYWYIFWHDVWSNNAGVEIFEKNADFLSPTSPDSICYTVMKRKDLNKKLREYSLQTFTGGGYLKKSILDPFYQRIKRISAGKDEINRQLEKTDVESTKS